ncbi:hypothetical protein [Polaromonas sp. A23]|uniref:hypothetical protein n=1 Tax=Polaromonas sp. A23 TaxID=1944133 RepID=UPI0009873BB4|nr:hypothetical protein [Polaromonas sp. A23]OOG40960.1 hypothetical protein B0B52_11425 [Polaromonas sp. A23]
MSSFISRVFRFILRLVLRTFATIFALSLLLATLVLLALGFLRSLITGQKPKPMVFGRFQRFSAQAPWQSAGMRDAAPARTGDVVDVEVREIRDDKRLP